MTRQRSRSPHWEMRKFASICNAIRSVAFHFRNSMDSPNLGPIATSPIFRVSNDACRERKQIVARTGPERWRVGDDGAGPGGGGEGVVGAGLGLPTLRSPHPQRRPRRRRRRRRRRRGASGHLHCPLSPLLPLTYTTTGHRVMCRSHKDSTWPRPPPSLPTVLYHLPRTARLRQLGNPFSILPIPEWLPFPYGVLHLMRQCSNFEDDSTFQTYLMRKRKDKLAYGQANHAWGPVCLFAYQSMR